MEEGSLLKKDFLRFEKEYFNNLSFKNNNFYRILDLESVEGHFCEFLAKNLLKSKNLDKLFINDIKNFVALLQKKDLNFSNFLYFKDEHDVLAAYMYLFMLKSFSLKSLKNSKDPNGLTNTSIREFLFDRDDFINSFVDLFLKFFLYNEMKFSEKFNYSKDHLRTFTFRFVELCVKEGLIVMHDIKIKNRLYKKINFIPFFVPYIPDIMLNTVESVAYVRSDAEFYSYNAHFGSIIQVTKQAKYNNSTFKISIDHVTKLLNRSVQIDRSLLNNSFKLLLANQKLKLNSDLNKTSLALSQKIEKALIENDIESLRFYHSKLSKILTLIRIKEILLMSFDNTQLYLPFMFCFRGRIYELSDLSFTFYKEFRFCLYKGEYTTEEENFHPINSQILSVIDQQFILAERFPWFKDLSLIRKRAFIWITVSIAAMQKEKLGEKIHISGFVKKGLELLEEGKVNNYEDVYEQIEHDYLLFLIEELKNSKNNLKKWIFWKDAPASCFQHLLLILGARNESSYKVCNLDSVDTFYDPYTYLILDFFEKNCSNDGKAFYLDEGHVLTKAKFFEIFTRKRLKKVFMTESYGAGKERLKSFFFLDLDLEKFSDNEKETITLIWKKFSTYVSDENMLFAQSSKEIVKHFISKNFKKIKNPDNTEVDYSCYKIQIFQREVYIEKKRHTLQNRCVTDEEDETQFKISVRANYVHTQDAVLARKYITITGMWSIHDCFSMDFLNITYMVALYNELINGDFFDIEINKTQKKRLFSIFSIL